MTHEKQRHIIHSAADAVNILRTEYGGRVRRQRWDAMTCMVDKSRLAELFTNGIVRTTKTQVVLASSPAS